MKAGIRKGYPLSFVNVESYRGYFRGRFSEAEPAKRGKIFVTNLLLEGVKNEQNTAIQPLNFLEFTRLWRLVRGGKDMLV